MAKSKATGAKSTGAMPKAHGAMPMPKKPPMMTHGGMVKPAK
jgi:hypothetical protein